MDSVIFFLELALLGFMISVGYNKFMLDKFRSELFDLRNSLFNLARASGDRLPFDSTEYRDVEATINSTIRYAEMITLLHLLFLSMTLKKAKAGVYHKILSGKKVDVLAESKLDSEILDSLRDMKKRSEYLWARQLLFARFWTASTVILGTIVYVLIQGVVGLTRMGFKTAEGKIIGRTEKYFRDEMTVVSRGRNPLNQTAV